MTQVVAFDDSAFSATNRMRPICHYTGGTAGGADSFDLRAVISAHVYDWLDELADVHAEIIEIGARRTPDIWLSGASRLDARPWGQAALIKPLFFARAITVWLRDHPAAGGLTVIGAPPDVAAHLRALAPDLEVRAHAANGTGRLAAVARVLRLSFWAWRDVIAVLRNHRGPRNWARFRTDALLLIQPVRGLSFRDARTYFFTSHLKEAASMVSVALTGTVDRRDRASPSDGSESDPQCLFDGITLGEALIAFYRALLRAADFRRLFIREGARPRSGFYSPLFWRRFANQLVDPGELFHALIVRRRLALMIADVGCRKVIFPYEEKGLERAIIQACKSAGIETLGYVPHPQHRLLTALQDRSGSSCPKPSGYALCGSAYLQFFRGWGGKVSAPMSVWGSSKGICHAAAPAKTRGPRMSVMLALSHPEELEMLLAWLRICPEITAHADLTLRPYPAADPALFERTLRDIERRHTNITVSSGDLAADLKRHRAVAFCATSAGLEAIMMGAVGLFVDLTNGFPINPCFDDTSAFRPSFTPGELAGNLAWLACADDSILHDLRAQQVNAVSKIFGPPDTVAVLHSIRGSK